MQIIVLDYLRQLIVIFLNTASKFVFVVFMTLLETLAKITKLINSTYSLVNIDSKLSTVKEHIFLKKRRFCCS